MRELSTHEICVKYTYFTRTSHIFYMYFAMYSYWLLRMRVKPFLSVQESPAAVEHAEGSLISVLSYFSYKNKTPIGYRNKKNRKQLADELKKPVKSTCI